MIDKISPLWGKMSYQEIADKVGSTAESVRKCGRKAGLAPYRVNSQNRTLTVEQELDRDVSLRSARQRENKKDDKLKVALDTINLLSKKVEVIKSIQDVVTTTIKVPTHQVNGATAVVLASDWHYWETVNPEQVDNLNEYNKTIAERRAERFFQSIVKLLSVYNKHSNIDTLVLALLGDFISGNIHDELMESNQGLVIDELMAVQSAIASGLEYLLENTNVKIILPCHCGNHGRITEKTHIATEAGNSLEYLMYHNLANYFKNEKRVEFRIARGYLSYVEIAGFTIRFHHGHSLRYAGGVGGIFIPAFKAISQWDKARRADLDCFGHFHQVKDGGKFISNGSLVGYNDYALRIKADYEKPKQVFFLVDHKRKEKTSTNPVFVE
jgi:hypothetical protein